MSDKLVSCESAPLDWSMVFESNGFVFERVERRSGSVLVAARHIASNTSFKATRSTFVLAAIQCFGNLKIMTESQVR